MTLYAKWTANQYTVTFDAKGGVLTDAEGSKTVTYGAAYGDLPAPTRRRLRFRGLVHSGRRKRHTGHAGKLWFP